MTQHTHQTAPTQFAEANGIRFAYRRFGKPNGVPLDQVLVHRGCDVKEADGVVTEIRKPELYARKPLQSALQNLLSSLVVRFKAQLFRV